MLVVVSPAKNLNTDPLLPSAMEWTRPRFAARAWELVKQLRLLSPDEVAALMKVSPELAALTVDRFRSFRARPAAGSTRPSLWMFDGQVYRGLDVATLSASELQVADDSIRILSGLYGVLRPRDAIQPYRLEMGSAFSPSSGGSLYDYWGQSISDVLRRDSSRHDIVVNLASREYFSAVQPAVVKRRIVECVFQDEGNNGTYRVLSFFAKQARGRMARFIVQHHISGLDGLREFDVDGYGFDPMTSGEDRLVFRRRLSDRPLLQGDTARAGSSSERFSGTRQQPVSSQ